MAAETTACPSTRTLLEAAPDTSEVMAAIGDDASTPLIAACGRGHTGAVQYLLECGAADIDQARQDSLHFCVAPRRVTWTL